MAPYTRLLILHILLLVTYICTKLVRESLLAIVRPAKGVPCRYKSSLDSVSVTVSVSFSLLA